MKTMPDVIKTLERYGVPTRQRIRARLRARMGDAPGKKEWRRLRELPELNDREDFKSHLCGPIDEPVEAAHV